MTPLPGDVLPVTVEAAMGADLTADPATWVWKDLSARLKGQATITRGRADEAQQTQAARLTIRLGNTDGWLTPRHPNSPWYLLWKRGTPLRLKITVPGDATYTRFQGRVTSVQPIWPSGNSDIAFVDVVAQGALYGLGQGSTPLRSPLNLAILGDNPLAYWPMEDGSGSTLIAEASGGTPMAIAGATPSLASGGPAGSKPLPTMAATTMLSAPIPASATGIWSVEFYIRIPSAPAGPTPIWTWPATGSSVALWQFVWVPATGVIGLEGYNAGGTQVLDSKGTFPFTLYGGDWLVTVVARNNGGSIQYSWQVANGSQSYGTSGTAAGTVNPLTSIYQSAADRTGWIYGHASVWDKMLDAPFNPVSYGHKFAVAGRSGELAADRITATCKAVGLPIAMVGPGTDTPRMGPVPTSSTPLAIMREAELADGGILTDGLNAGLNYLPEVDRYNRPVALALDANLGQVKLPFEPIEDDQRLRNLVMVSRPNGSSATSVDPSVKTEGEYDNQVSMNLSSDFLLADEASWLAHLGTVPEMRAPVITIDVRDRPELLKAWLGMDIGWRYTVANPPTQYPPGGLDLVLEQYTEVIDGITYRVNLTGSPFAPWRVFVLDQDRLDADPSSQLVAGITATATTMQVQTANIPGASWTTDPAEWAAPKTLYINIGGEQMRVTNITGASSPQTFTVIRSINGVVKAQTAGAAVGRWQPRVLAL